jgi:hypothetical protein
MIKKTIIIGISLFLIYTFFVTFLAPYWWKASQHQWQDNIIKAQKYIYDENGLHSNVIVGSSLSCRLIMDSIPQTYNLSFGGQSLFDGLNILTHSEKLPENVFIEINFVIRPEDKSFTSSLNSVLFYPKKYLLSMRDNKQPIGVIGKLISYRIIGRIISHTKAFLNLADENEHNDDDIFPKMLQLQKDNYSIIPSESFLKESFENLKEYIVKLEKKNIKVIFFEMPVNYQLNNLPRANLIRKTFYEYFPKSSYKYISIPEFEKFVTSDGVHLSGDEAKIYTMYLKRNMENYFR